MDKIKIFMGASTSDGLPELEQQINKWAEKEKVTIKNLSITIREVGAEERQSLTSEITDQLLICITYEQK